VGSLVGITGAPGAGKSSLTTVITQELRRRGMQVGIIAVDPSSPLSGGSLLGDRIRMYDLAGDSGVFIRSMANRGQYGGLAASTLDAAMLMRAAGFGMVLLETVGAGQSDVAVVDVADTVLLVESPGMGDEVQSIKAGLLEVADVIVVSKSDRPDSSATLQQLRALMRMQMGSDDVWSVPVLPVSAIQQTGVAELVDALLAHAEWLQVHPPTWRQQRRYLLALQRAIDVQLREALQQLPGWSVALAQLGQYDSDLMARQLLEEFVANGFTKE
ncbi:MAG: methylmalonyl Co-A mutase-associated GTPase MeaB, partial [Chloroflexia bacterium]|nr:methylmalonyl Co-A mutase-associated GTPase MeaB [Chloroflexia bacterium]